MPRWDITFRAARRKVIIPSAQHGGLRQSMYIKPLEIGNVELKNNIILAPMAGITDLPFRIIYQNFGMGLQYSEMASAKAICYKDEKTKKLVNMDGQTIPIALQLFGSDSEIIGEAIQIIQSKEWEDIYSKVSIIDINMGCPAPKVTKNGDGSSLLKDLNLIQKITERAVRVSQKPVTIKIRKGYDKNNIVAVEVAKIAESTGVSAVAIHGRTRDEFFTGEVDLDIIKQIKNAAKIPIIGNGNIFCKEDAEKMFQTTGCDGIMIGRGALGNPWIFPRIVGSGLDPTANERLSIILKHIDLSVQYKGELTGIKEMRKQIAWYVKGLKDASKIRDKVNKIEDKEELEGCLIEYFRTLCINM